MRQRRTLLFGLLCMLLVGCVTGQPAPSTAGLDRFQPFQGPTGADVVQLDVAIVERPFGDRYLNEGLWLLADEQAVPLEQKALLTDNGFRIGQIAGTTPAPLQELLTSAVTCVNPRRIQLRAGRTTALVLGPDLAECSFGLEPAGEAKPLTLRQAQCTLLVAPSLTGDGRIQLKFTPQILHGDNSVVVRTAADRSGWLLEEQRPKESYDSLSWEVTVSPNEYVVVGGSLDRPQTLGHRCFIRPQEKTPVQRLLVIRTARTLPGLADEALPRATTAAQSGASPPLAYQAAWTTARGNSPQN